MGLELSHRVGHPALLLLVPEPPFLDEMEPVFKQFVTLQQLNQTFAFAGLKLNELKLNYAVFVHTC